MAIVAGETEDAVDRALKLVKVQYEVLPAILDSGLPRITRSWSIRGQLEIPLSCGRGQ